MGRIWHVELLDCVKKNALDAAAVVDITIDVEVFRL